MSFFGKDSNDMGSDERRHQEPLVASANVLFAGSCAIDLESSKLQAPGPSIAMCGPARSIAGKIHSLRASSLQIALACALDH